MELVTKKRDLKDYLIEDDNIDYSHPIIQDKIEELYEGADTEVEKVKKAFEFVRDEIHHSWDIRSRRITRKASEVLKYKEGICYAKSNLLAALLRGIDIPTGFCYQKLTIGNIPESGYCLHALNAVYLSKYKKWIRLDARGNTGRINSKFSIDKEKLGFKVRNIYHEEEYPTIYNKPLKKTMDVLKNSTNFIKMYENDLPKRI